MKRFLRLYLIEQKFFFRSADMIVFSLCMPTAAFLLIAAIAGGKPAGDGGLTYLQGAFASLSTVGICCCAFMSIPILIVDSRDRKILKHFYCTPCSPLWLLGADVICCAVMSLLSAALVTASAVLFFGYRMPGNPAVYAGTWLLTMAAMFSVGLLIAGLCGTVKTMNVVTSLVYFPMLFLSGATIPYELFPAGLRQAADLMPLNWGIRLMKEASLGSLSQGSLWLAVMLVLLTGVCTVLSVKTFRWD